MMNVLLRQPASARDCAGELIEYSESVGLPPWSAYGRVYAGWAMMAKGHFREARTAIVTGLAMLEQTGNRRNSTLLFTWAAQAEMHNDNPDEAMNWLMKAFAILDATNDVIWAPELYRTRGEIALQFRGDAVGAERDFQAALDLARRTIQRCSNFVPPRVSRDFGVRKESASRRVICSHRSAGGSPKGLQCQI